jgi:predicted Zn-dependent peptidase
LMTVDEILAKIESVTLDDTRNVAAELLAPPGSLAVIGPYGEDSREFAA